MDGKRQGLQRFENVPFLKPFLFYLKHCILDIYIDAFV